MKDLHNLLIALLPNARIEIMPVGEAAKALAIAGMNFSLQGATVNAEGVVTLQIHVGTTPPDGVALVGAKFQDGSVDEGDEKMHGYLLNGDYVDIDEFLRERLPEYHLPDEQAVRLHIERMGINGSLAIGQSGDIIMRMT